MIKRKRYTSILTIMFSTVVLLLLLIIITFFLSGLDIYKNSNEEFQERSLKQAANAVEIVIKQIDENLEDSLRNNFFSNYISFPRGQYFENIKGAIDEADKNSLYDYLKVKSMMQSSLNYLRFSNDYLNTVYFYDGKNQLFYTDDQRQFDTISFPDAAAISYTQKLKNESIGSYIFDIRVEKELNESKTLLPVVYLNNPKQYNYYLIANLDIKKLSEDIFSELYAKDKGNIYVVNDDGDIILSNNPQEIGSNIKKIENGVLSIKKNTGEWRVESKDDSLYVLKHQIDVFDFYIVSTNRGDSLNKDITKIIVTIIVITVVALLISVLAAYFVTRRLFNPIRDIIQKIEKAEPNISNPDEFGEILDFIEKNSKLRDDLERSLPLYKEKVLEWKLSGQDLKPDNKSHIYKMLDISEENDEVLIIAAAGDWHGRKLQDKITQIITQEINCTVLSIGSNMLYFCHDTAADMNSSIDKISKKVDGLEDDVWIGVGDTVGFNDCSFSYQQALFCISFLKARKTPGIVTYNKTLEENIGIVDLMNDNKLRALEQAIKLSDFAQAKRIYNDAVDEIKSFLPALSVFQIRNEIFTLSSAVFNCMYEYMPNSELSMRYYKLLSQIHSEDLDVIRAATLEIIEHMQAMSSDTIKHSKYDDYVESTKTIIETEYSSDVSLIGVAERLGITPEYLSKLFKDKESIGFVDYLTKCRMKKAQELIVNLNYSISKIADMVGFQNTEYFSRVFKKHFGIPPGKYRHQVRILSSNHSKDVKN